MEAAILQGQTGLRWIGKAKGEGYGFRPLEALAIGMAKVSSTMGRSIVGRARERSALVTSRLKTVAAAVETLAEPATNHDPDESKSLHLPTWKHFVDDLSGWTVFQLDAHDRDIKSAVPS